MLRERLTFANVMSSIAVFIALGGGAYAVTGSGGGLDGTEYAQSGKRIYACVAKRSGTFELANRSKRCGKGERKISWQVKGPRGKRGKRGAKGDVGVRGSRGPQGVMGPEGPQGPAGENGENGSPDTPEQVLDKLLEVDGPGSGLNAEYAELLGGIPASGFVQGSGGILTRGVSVDVGDGQDEAPLGSVFGLGSFRLVGDPDPIGPGDKCMIVFHNQSGAELLFSDGVELANGQQEVMIGVNTDNATYSERLTISDATGTRFMNAQFEVAYGDTWMSDSPDLCAGFVSGTHS